MQDAFYFLIVYVRQNLLCSVLHSSDFSFVLEMLSIFSLSVASLLEWSASSSTFRVVTPTRMLWNYALRAAEQLCAGHKNLSGKVTSPPASAPAQLTTKKNVPLFSCGSKDTWLWTCLEKAENYCLMSRNSCHVWIPWRSRNWQRGLGQGKPCCVTDEAAHVVWVTESFDFVIGKPESAQS